MTPDEVEFAARERAEVIEPGEFIAGLRSMDEAMRALRLQSGPIADGWDASWPWSCREGVVVAEHDFVGVNEGLPDGYEYDLPGYCFDNAATLAADDESLTYVEGYAQSVIPIHHAWCVTEDGVVVDTTWQKKFSLPVIGRTYVGIRFATDLLRSDGLSMLSHVPVLEWLAGGRKGDPWL